MPTNPQMKCDCYQKTLNLKMGGGTDNSLSNAFFFTIWGGKSPQWKRSAYNSLSPSPTSLEGTEQIGHAPGILLKDPSSLMLLLSLRNEPPVTGPSEVSIPKQRLQIHSQVTNISPFSSSSLLCSSFILRKGDSNLFL